MLLINLTDGAGFIINRKHGVTLLTHSMLLQQGGGRPSVTIKHARTKKDKGKYLSRQTSTLVHQSTVTTFYHFNVSNLAVTVFQPSNRRM